ncbi:MAG: DNA polymerase III subunit chi [Pseudomonadota bacterium]
MTALAFHFGAPDKLAYTCRLLRKAIGSGAKVVLVADADVMAQMDADLWALSPAEFLPHCLATANASVQSRSPLVLVTDAGHAPQQSGVLVNLMDTVPQGFERFERVIEVVSTDATDRDRARRRWRQYTERGYTITRHDLTLKRVD